MSFLKPKTPALAEHVEGVGGPLAGKSLGELVPVPLAWSRVDSASAIRREADDFMAGLSQSAAKAIGIGERLVAAKEHVRHGEWEDYVTLECGLKLSTARMCMKLAREKSKLDQFAAANRLTSSGLTQAQALKFLSVGAQRRSKPTKKPKPKPEPVPPKKKFLGIW